MDIGDRIRRLRLQRGLTQEELAKALYFNKSTVTRQIAALENKMKKEKQLNRRMEMNAEMKGLRKEIDFLK